MELCFCSPHSTHCSKERGDLFFRENGTGASVLSTWKLPQQNSFNVRLQDKMLLKNACMCQHLHGSLGQHKLCRRNKTRSLVKPNWLTSYEKGLSSIFMVAESKFAAALLAPINESWVSTLSCSCIVLNILAYQMMPAEYKSILMMSLGINKI